MIYIRPFRVIIANELYIRDIVKIRVGSLSLSLSLSPDVISLLLLFVIGILNTARVIKLMLSHHRRLDYIPPAFHLRCQH